MIHVVDDSIKTFIQIFIQLLILILFATCHVLLYCIKVSAVFVLTLLLIITNRSVVFFLHVVELLCLLYT